MNKYLYIGNLSIFVVKKYQSKGQKRSFNRKKFSKALKTKSVDRSGIPVRGTLIATRDHEEVKGIRGFFTGYEITQTDEIIVQYHTQDLESKANSLPRELPYHVSFKGTTRKVIYREVAKPTYEPEKKE